MNRRYRGVMTIEAAVVFPFVMLVLATLLYMAKVIYIQDQVHSALMTTAHELSVDLYAVDKIGLTDIQQSAYREGATSLGSLSEAQSDITTSGSEIVSVVDQAVGDVMAFQIPESLDGNVDWEGGQESLVDQAKKVVTNGPAMITAVSENIQTITSVIKSLYSQGAGHLTNIALMEMVDLANGVVAKELSEVMMYQQLPKTYLSKLGVANGGELDLSMSSVMLYDDTITLVAVYEIDIPFGQDWLIGNIPVMQKVTVRSWTGSYGSDEIKQRIAKDSSETEKIYYISTGDSSNHSYHVLTCLKKPLTISTYHEEVEEKGRKICSYCNNHFTAKDHDEVYFTSSKAAIHLKDTCPIVCAKGIIAVTEEEAINVYGRQPCKKAHCVAELKGEEE